MSKLREILDSTQDLKPAVRMIVNTIAERENIPRKKPKFMNFVKNIGCRASPHDIEQTWELFSQAVAPPKPQPQPKSAESMESTEEGAKTEEPEKKKKKKSKKNGLEENEVEKSSHKESNKEKRKKQKKGKENEASVETPMEVTDTSNKKEKKGKKRKHENEEESTADMNSSTADDTMEVDEPAAKKVKFDWDATIQAVLAKKGNQMKLKKLKKKCVSEYFVQNPSAHQTPEQIGTKFDKKINKRQKYKVVGEEVELNTKEQDDVEDSATNGCDTKATAAATNGGAKESENADDKSEEDSKGNGISWNAWEATSLGNDAQTEKFRRLMGIKTTVKPQDLAGVKKRDDRAIFRDLEQGFKQARTTHFKEKGMGLGFAHGD